MSYDWAALERDLRRLLPARGVVSKRQELLSYDCDGLTLERQCPPLAVLPETTEQVAAVLRCCDAHSIPFVARGSGTGLSGGAPPDRPVPLPRATKGMLWASQQRRTAATCSVVSGNTAKGGHWRSSVKPSQS